MKTYFDPAFGAKVLMDIGASATLPPVVFPFLQNRLPEKIEDILERSYPSPGWFDDYDNFKPGFIFKSKTPRPEKISFFNYDQRCANYLIPDLACAANIILSNDWRPSNNDNDKYYHQQAYDHLPDIFDFVESVKNMTFVSELAPQGRIYWSYLRPHQ